MRVFIALAALVMVSCISRGVTKIPPPPPAATQSDLSGAPFTLTAISVKGKEIALPATRLPTMQFTESNRVSGLAGVNRYSGEGTLSANGEITFGPMIATKMAGPADAMSLEASFLDALSQVTRVALYGSILKLTSADASTRLELTR